MVEILNCVKCRHFFVTFWCPQVINKSGVQPSDNDTVFVAASKTFFERFHFLTNHTLPVPTKVKD